MFRHYSSSQTRILLCIRPAVAAISILVALCSHAYSVTWHVPMDAPTIQAGIDSAGVGDTVVVVCNHYEEHDISMKSGVYLTSQTGDPDCATVDARGRGRVFYCSGVDSASVIDGFTITGGRASGVPAEYEIVYDDGSPEFALALNDSLNGGAVRFTPAAYPAKVGRARVFVVHTGNPLQEFRVCVYDDDGPDGVGGTVLATAETMASGGNRWTEVDFSSDDIIISDGDFYIGVIWLTGASQDTTQYLGFDLNGTFEDRSWLILNSGALWDTTDLHDNHPGGEWMIRATVYGPMPGKGVAGSDFMDGAGICCDKSALTIRECRFSGNWADDQGGGLYCDSSDVEVIGCVFDDNLADVGGGICNLSSSPVIRACTFYGNSAITSGDAIQVDGADALTTVSTSILAFNLNAGALGCSDFGTAALSCSDVFGNVGGDWTGCISGQDTLNGNFSEDPVFCAADSGDFRIDDESMCAAVNSPCGLRIGAMDASQCVTAVDCWGLSVTAAAGEIAVTWHASLEADVSSFQVQRSTRFGDSFQNLDGAIRQTAPGSFSYPDGEVLYGTRYWYQVIAKTGLGVATLGPVSASPLGHVPSDALTGSFPNPFNPSTSICFTLSKKASPTVRIFDASGGLVREMMPGELDPGEHTLLWDGKGTAGPNLPSGVYFCKFIVPGTVTSGKLLIVE